MTKSTYRPYGQNISRHVRSRVTPEQYQFMLESGKTVSQFIRDLITREMNMVGGLSCLN
jgi:hypothetical protein